MIQKLKNVFLFVSKINLVSFIYLNYFCKAVVRTDKSRIIPYKHAIIEFAPGSRMFLAGGDMEIGCEILKGSKAETHIRLRENAVWSAQGGCSLAYNVTVEVLSGALLESKFFTMNSNSVLIAAKKIVLGQDVMIARNVVIYDSDFHSILGQKGEVLNESKPVILGDHIWLGTNSIILKGTEIGNNSIVGANSIIRAHIDENTIATVENRIVYRKNPGGWERKAPN